MRVIEGTILVTVDLSEVAHIDSSGIATLIEALKIARARNTNLSLKGSQCRLLDVLEVTGIAALFGLGNQGTNVSQGDKESKK